MVDQLNLELKLIKFHRNKKGSTSITFILITDVFHFQVQGGKGSISAIYNWFENVYRCTDLNPDQYKQYLLRSSAVTKPLFKAKRHKGLH